MFLSNLMIYLDVIFIYNTMKNEKFSKKEPTTRRRVLYYIRLICTRRLYIPIINYIIIKISVISIYQSTYTRISSIVSVFPLLTYRVGTYLEIITVTPKNYLCFYCLNRFLFSVSNHGI